MTIRKSQKLKKIEKFEDRENIKSDSQMRKRRKNRVKFDRREGRMFATFREARNDP